MFEPVLPADYLTLTDSPLPSAAHEKHVELSTGHTFKKAPLPIENRVFRGIRPLSAELMEVVLREHCFMLYAVLSQPEYITKDTSIVQLRFRCNETPREHQATARVGTWWCEYRR